MRKNTKNSPIFLDYFKGSVIPTSEESLNVSRKSKLSFHRNICPAFRHNLFLLLRLPSGLTAKKEFTLLPIAISTGLEK